ncbi:hypothetical protein GGU10DRAFT_335557 [Lentinula aff. detonsa]|uniref:Uncharacterized protein n=1 Tax=Lentinula aff. detonsa TaxID=2804958 RepID=A0AA38KUP1_9AGAR|nr:hypothetical protein GGU10DRAFT_335557 [Lentinula aff. detonsa]
MPLTRSQTRKNASQSLFSPGTLTGGAPRHRNPLDRPIRLKGKKAAKASPDSPLPTPEAQATYRKLECAKAQTLLQVLTDKQKAVAQAPNQKSTNFIRKPLQRYETPLNLVGNAVKDPALLNAPKANRVRRHTRPSFQAVVDEFSNQQAGQPRAHWQRTTTDDILYEEEDCGAGAGNLNGNTEKRYFDELSEEEKTWMQQFDAAVPVPVPFEDQEQLREYMNKFEESMKAKIRESIES